MDKSKVQGLLNSIKQLFTAAEGEPVKFVEYKLADGTMISCDKMEVGGIAKIGDAPAAAGSYTLEDGSSITVGENGAITAITPKADDTDMSTPEGMRKAYDKFATGTPEERLGNLETLCKALMEYSFGWQLREAQAKQTTDAAIKVYKELSDTTAQQVTQQTALMKQMFELVQEMAGAPISDTPPNPKKTSSFSKVDVKVSALEKYQAAAKKISEQLKVAS